MKSFKTLLSEVAQPSERGAEEEQAFKDQHSYEVKEHPVALPHQHTGEIAKPKASRKADQEGSANYDTAYAYGMNAIMDKVMGEEAQLDENPQEEIPMMSQQLDFIAMAAKAIKESLKGGGDPEEWYQGKLGTAHDAMKTLHANIKGDSVDESKEMSAAKALDKATASTAAGKKAVTLKKAPWDKTEALKGAQKELDHDKDGDIDGADFAKMRAKAKKKLNATYESVEELDEISKTKMGQYIKRAHSDKDTQKKRASIFDKKGMDADKDKDMYKQFGNADKARKKAANRTKFIGKAVDKLTKEEVELDEVSQETLKSYHAKSALDLRNKRDKLEKGTLTTKDHKQGQNRVTGLNRAANKMEEVELDEAFKVGLVKLKDNSSIVLKKEDADVLNKLFKKMSSGSSKKMTETAMKDKEGFAEILSFAKEAL